MTASNQKPSTISSITMRLLLRKRIICCVLIGCCLVVLAWLTFEQGRSPTRGETEARWRHAKIDPDIDDQEDDHGGVVVKQEGDEEEDERRGGQQRQKTGNSTSSRNKDTDYGKKKSEGKGGGSKKGSKKSSSLVADIENLGMKRGDAEVWIKDKIKLEFCNPPDREITGEEGKFKPGYELRSAYVVTRHGDRTPMVEFTDIPNGTWNPHWNCDLKEAIRRGGSTLLAEFIRKMEAEIKQRRGDMKDVPGYFKSLPIGTGARCQKSQLTPIGWQQHMKLGNFIRSVYEKSLVSDPEELGNVSVFKSTVNTRTQQSAFSFMYGFLRDVTLKDTTRIRTVSNVNFCPLDMCACPALEHLVKQKETEHSKIMHGNKDFMKVMKNIAQTLYGSDKTTRLPGINGVAEILSTLVCHSMLYPCGPGGCINPLQHALYTRYIMATWLAQSQVEDGTYEKLGRMFIHPFLTDMTKNMYRISQGSSKNRFVFNSGHDITIRPMADALKLKGPAWPHYASRIVFELWKKSSSNEHFLRILGYGKDQTDRVQFCRDKLNEDGLCPFSALLTFVETDNMEYFYSESYQEACARTYWPN